MCYMDICIPYLPKRHDHLMYTPMPNRLRAIADQPLPVIGKGRLSPFIKGSIIDHHNHVTGIFPQFFLQIKKLPFFFSRKHIICIQPHQILFCPFGKSKISGCRKVITPQKIVDFVCKFRRNLLCSVHRACIHNNDLLHHIRNTFQTPCQHILFIPYNHA